MNKDIKQQISDKITSLSGEDTRLAELLSYCIGRLCLKYSKDSGDWQNDLSKIDVGHIVDWLKAALINDADWLNNVDDQNRPKKLMKFSDFNSVIQEADKAMLLSAQRNSSVELIEGDEELYQQLDDGYYLVKLLTPGALNRESSQMQHCVGDGAYSNRLNNNDRYILSLRDRNGNPHITVEVKNGVVVQLQGKQNKAPLLKYAKTLSPLFATSNLKIDIPISRLGYVVSNEGEIFDVDKLPDGLKISGDFDLRDVKISNLPNGLEVGGVLFISHTDIKTLPYGLKVGAHLDLYKSVITSLPDCLEVGQGLFIAESEITSLPGGLKVGGDIDISHTKITQLPDNLEVNGNFSIRFTNIKSLPDNLKVKKTLDMRYAQTSSLPDKIEVGGSLNLCHSDVEILPDGLEVGEWLDLRHTAITSLPDGLKVGKGLDINHTKIKSLPENIEVGGAIEFPAGFDLNKSHEARPI